MVMAVAQQVRKPFDLTAFDAEVSERYLVLLVDTWLRNVLQPLAAEPPPALDRMRELGLVARLREGHAVTRSRWFL